MRWLPNGGVCGPVERIRSTHVASNSLAPHKPFPLIIYTFLAFHPPTCSLCNLILRASEYRYLSLSGHIWISSGIPDVDITHHAPLRTFLAAKYRETASRIVAVRAEKPL